MALGFTGHAWSLKKTTKSRNLTNYTFCLLLHSLKFHLLKTSRWMHDYCPILMLFIPQQLKSFHNSTLNFESCLFLSVLFSGLLLNFTVVSLPLPEYSLQCFYTLLTPPPVFFPVVAFSSAGTVLLRLNWRQGKTYWIKGHLFSFLCKMNEKVFKGSFTKTPPSHTTLFPPSP